MAFWDGTRWVLDAQTAAPRSSGGRRLSAAAAEACLITVLLFGLIASATLAARGGNGRPQQPTQCVVEGFEVTASELPTDEVINFMLTDASGSHGWVLGFTDTGSWTEPVPPRDGATTYEFVSRTYGRDGAKYRVFATCSA